jgi:hypothetical protein
MPLPSSLFLCFKAVSERLLAHLLSSSLVALSVTDPQGNNK